MVWRVPDPELRGLSAMKKTLEERQQAMKARQAGRSKAVSASEATRFQPGESRAAGPGRPNSPLPLTAGPVVRQRLAEIDTRDSRHQRKVEKIIDTLYLIATDPK